VREARGKRGEEAKKDTGIFYSKTYEISSPNNTDNIPNIPIITYQWSIPFLV
jgi:hypothetical protein